MSNSALAPRRTLVLRLVDLVRGVPRFVPDPDLRSVVPDDATHRRLEFGLDELL